MTDLLNFDWHWGHVIVGIICIAFALIWTEIMVDVSLDGKERQDD